MSKLGFVGLGIMGTPWPAISSPPVTPSSPTIRSRSPKSWSRRVPWPAPPRKEVAEKCDIFFVMVPDTPHVGAVLFGGENGAAEGLSAGKIVVGMSSISPI